jgi:hypothetical protein
MEMLEHRPRRQSCRVRFTSGYNMAMRATPSFMEFPKHVRRSHANARLAAE